MDLPIEIFNVISLYVDTQTKINMIICSKYTNKYLTHPAISLVKDYFKQHPLINYKPYKLTEIEQYEQKNNILLPYSLKTYLTQCSSSIDPVIFDYRINSTKSEKETTDNDLTDKLNLYCNITIPSYKLQLDNYVDYHKNVCENSRFINYTTINLGDFEYITSEDEVSDDEIEIDHDWYYYHNKYDYVNNGIEFYNKKGYIETNIQPNDVISTPCLTIYMIISGTHIGSVWSHKKYNDDNNKVYIIYNNFYTYITGILKQYEQYFENLNKPIDLNVLEINYNILRIISGMPGLSYSN